MNKISRFLVITVAGGLFLAACGSIAQGMAAPTGGGTGEDVIVISPAMKNKPVSLKVGDTFEVQIPTIPTAGYNWQVENLDPAILLQVGDPVFEANSDPAGAGGIATIRFTVVGAGTTKLSLIYAHPAEGSAPSLYKNSFGVTIEAK